MLKYILILLFLLVGVIIFRTWKFKSKVKRIAIDDEVEVDSMKIAEKLSNMIQFRTLSNADYEKVDDEAFDRQEVFLESAFPGVHRVLDREVINRHGLLYHWESDIKNKKPILFLAHLDVVPVESESEWHHPPFSGKIANGYVWGRGALDIKSQVVAMLEAVECMLEKNMTPERDVYLAFGFDEEVGGTRGAKEIAKILEARNMEFEYIIDEGGCVTIGAMPGIDFPLATIGTGEKGKIDIKLSKTADGGHSSMPPQSTSLGEIAKAVVALEGNQMKMKLTQPVKDMLRHIGPEMDFKNRLMISNLWLFKPIIMRGLNKDDKGNAMLRTTTAATMASGSQQANVLPQTASATFNFRVIPGDQHEDLLEHIDKTLKRDDIKVESIFVENPSKSSPSDSHAFKVLELTAYQIFPETLVTPYLVMGATDARNYENLSDNIYRFSPYMITDEELKTIHSTNERISIKNLERMVKFYVQLIKNTH